jgi:hypothetical protein
MTTITAATDNECRQALFNCYGSYYAEFNAIVHFNRYGVFPFNPQWN